MLLILFKSLLLTSVHPRQRPNKQCVRFTQCSYFNSQSVLHKLFCPAVWADFTEWHHVVSKMLSVQKVYCNTLWCFVIRGQAALVITRNKSKKKLFSFHFCFIFHFFILHLFFFCPIKWSHIQVIIYYITVVVTTNGKSVVTETLPGCHWTFSYFVHSFEYNNEFHHS